jgi:hypothetical protein
MRRLRAPWALAAAAVLLLAVASACTPSRDSTASVPTFSPSDAGGSPTVSGCQRWIDPSGNDGASGTEGRPWSTLQHAADAVPDDSCTVWVGDGSYSGVNSIDRGFSTQTVFRALHPYMPVFTSGSAALDIGGDASNMTFSGLQFTQSAPGSGVLVYVSGGTSGPAPHDITFVDNIIHDSYGDDLLKIRSLAHGIVVRGNVFYNQSDDEQHIDVNSVTDVTIEDNIFFNDFAVSGRKDTKLSKHFIVVKDSNQADDGLFGSHRIEIRRNIFLSWQGGEDSMIALGNDGNPTFEAVDVRIDDNLMLGNGTDQLTAALTVYGAENVSFFNNTVAGDLPSTAYAFKVNTKRSNPKNRNIGFWNNIWSDPTGTMGDLSDGDPSNTVGFTLDHNLYWNGGAAIRAGSFAGPPADPHHVLADPMLPTDQSGIVLPVWTGSSFQSGTQTIRDEFIRLVTAYGLIPSSSPAVGAALASVAPPVDILGHPRDASPDIGAYEA